MPRKPVEQEQAERQLARVLDFLAVPDVRALDDGAIASWRATLERLYLPRRPKEIPYFFPRTPDAEVRAMLIDLHRDAANGLRGLLRGEGWSGLPRLTLVGVLEPDRGRRPGARRYYWQSEAKTEGQAMLAGLADLVSRGGVRLRVCKSETCARLFIAQKHGLFHELACQQRTLNRLKTAARKQARADARQQRTARKQRTTTKGGK